MGADEEESCWVSRTSEVRGAAVVAHVMGRLARKVSEISAKNSSRKTLNRSGI